MKLNTESEFLMKTNNVDFGKSFKFKHKNAGKDNDAIYTYTLLEDCYSALVTWPKTRDFPAGSCKYLFDEARDLVEDGLWVVLPSETTDYTRECIDKLNAWTGCMSYNDSYFGEPAGMLKSTIRQLDKTYKVNIATDMEEIVGDTGPELSFQTNTKITDTLLNEIKSFTTTSKHSVNIYNGAYEVFRSGEDMAYQCKDDETLRSVMQALKVLDGVVHD